MPYIDLVRFSDKGALQKYAEKFRQKFIAPQGGDYSFQLVARPGQEVSAKKGVFVVVQGGSMESNAFAVSSPRVDILLAPVSAKKPEFDIGMCRLAKQNKTIIALDFSQFLGAQKKERSLLFKNYLFAAKLCKRAKPVFCVFSGARDEFGLRQAKDFSSVLCMFGYGREQALKNVGGLEEFLLGRKKLEGFEVLEK